ncbi:MAG: HupE/UreJ family protein [Nitrospinae bacterium]|nr:HupE/UreJ family protein [Nitrospinota bacterium]
MFNLILLTIVAVLFVPQIGYCHQVTGGGFYSGLEHPVMGPDHLLAMLSVGIISAQIGGRAIWTVPATFVSVMTIGGIIGILGLPVPLVEYGIVASVVLLGVAIAMDQKTPIVATMVFVGFFAIFHGHAHGVEMPVLASPALYALGFMTGTTCIHLTGVLIGYIFTLKKQTAYVLRFVGILIAFKGVQLYMNGF